MRNSVLSTLLLAAVIAVGLDAAGVSARALVHEARAMLVPFALTALAIVAAVLLPTLALSLGLRSFRELEEDEWDAPIEEGPARSGVSFQPPGGTRGGKVPLPLRP